MMGGGGGGVMLAQSKHNGMAADEPSDSIQTSLVASEGYMKHLYYTQSCMH